MILRLFVGDAVGDGLHGLHLNDLVLLFQYDESHSNHLLCKNSLSE